jgi:hypothetical protein
MLDPVYRHWIEAERADREALKAQPRMPLLLFLLSDVLASVGRWTDAADLAQKFDRSQFLIAGAERKVVVSLWSAGDFQRADDAMRIAVGHWPRNPYVWRTHLAYLTYSGRASEARALLRDPNRPPEISSDYVSAASATVDAVAGQEKAADAIERNLAYLKGEAAAVFMVAHACAALGAADPLFAILNGYYFGQGDWRSTAPPAGDEDRVTAPLFMPPMRKMWRETRFDQLVTRVGLTDYWRQSGTTPDYRRSA